METITLNVTGMANGGMALGRDDGGRVVFLPFAIPGEVVTAEIVDDRGRYAHGRILSVDQPGPERLGPRCRHFGLCGGCSFQHIEYQAQLHYKKAIVLDQLKRIGGIANAPISDPLASPEQWAYLADVSFEQTAEGQPGFWSPALGRVMAIVECHIIRPELLDLFHDLDLDLPSLRRLTLRLGSDGSLLAALEVGDEEAPSLSADFPVSVAMVLEDGTTANLIGDNSILRSTKGRDFRVMAGCFSYPNPPLLDVLVETLSGFAQLNGQSSVLELYSGVGTFTAFLAEQAGEVACIEANEDAVSDAAFNLDHLDNVSLYDGLVEDVLPLLNLSPKVVVVDPPAGGLPRTVVDQVARLAPQKIVYVSSDIAALARDGKRLTQAGYLLREVQPVDMYPQTPIIQTVSQWVPSG